MGMIACPNCGMQVDADAAGCQNCGADPKTGAAPGRVEKHERPPAPPQQSDRTGGSRFFALPATLPGRVSAWLFLAVLVIWVVNMIHDFSLTIGSVNVVLPIVVVAVCGMIISGAAALIAYHERSWAVWVSTLTVALLMAAELITALIGSS